jgi:hypothetical protein
MIFSNHPMLFFFFPKYALQPPIRGVECMSPMKRLIRN